MHSLDTVAQVAPQGGEVKVFGALLNLDLVQDGVGARAKAQTQGLGHRRQKRPRLGDHLMIAKDQSGMGKVLGQVGLADVV